MTQVLNASNVTQGDLAKFRDTWNSQNHEPVPCLGVLLFWADVNILNKAEMQALREELIRVGYEVVFKPSFSDIIAVRLPDGTWCQSYSEVQRLVFAADNKRASERRASEVALPML